MSARLTSRGFTIIELMIATAVLSVILIIVSSVFISISNLYSKGINGSRLQDNVRGIMQNVAGTVQFSQINVTYQSGMYNGGTTLEYAYCVGNQRYSYAPDTLPGQGVTYAIYQDTYTPDPINGCTPKDLTGAASTITGGKNLGLPHEAIHHFDISQSDTGDLLTVTIGAFIAPDVVGVVDVSQPEAHCEGNIGDQFCATSQLSTSVDLRVSTN